MQIKKFVQLKTKRMVLKPLVASFSFANDLFEMILKNRSYYKYEPWTFYWEKAEQAYAFLQDAENCWKNSSKAIYGMYLRKNGDFVGMCGMFNINWNAESLKIGYMLNPKYAKQGLMDETVKTVLKTYFKSGFKRIVIMANPENIDSCKIAEKNGFEYEGLLKSYRYNPYFKKRENFALYAKVKEK